MGSAADMEKDMPLLDKECGKPGTRHGISWKVVAVLTAMVATSGLATTIQRSDQSNVGGAKQFAHVLQSLTGLDGLDPSPPSQECTQGIIAMYPQVLAVYSQGHDPVSLEKAVLQNQEQFQEEGRVCKVTSKLTVVVRAEIVLGVPPVCFEWVEGSIKAAVSKGELVSPPGAVLPQIEVSCGAGALLRMKTMGEKSAVPVDMEQKIVAQEVQLGRRRGSIWHLANKASESCTDACHEIGRQCTEAHWPRSEEAAKEAFWAAGVSCKYFFDTGSLDHDTTMGFCHWGSNIQHHCGFTPTSGHIQEIYNVCACI